MRDACQYVKTYSSPLLTMSVTHRMNPWRHDAANTPVSSKTPHIFFFSSFAAAFQFWVHCRSTSSAPAKSAAVPPSSSTSDQSLSESSSTASGVPCCGRALTSFL